MSNEINILEMVKSYLLELSILVNRYFFNNFKIEFGIIRCANGIYK